MGLRPTTTAGSIRTSRQPTASRLRPSLSTSTTSCRTSPTALSGTTSARGPATARCAAGDAPTTTAGTSRDEVSPPAPAPIRPLRARPVAEAAYVAADSRLRRDRVRSPGTAPSPRPRVLIAGGDRRVVCGGWLVFRSPSSTGRTVDRPGADERPARTEQGCADSGERSQAAPGSATAPASSAAAGRARRIPHRNGSTRAAVHRADRRRRSRGSTSPGRR